MQNQETPECQEQHTTDSIDQGQGQQGCQGSTDQQPDDFSCNATMRDLKSAVSNFFDARFMIPPCFRTPSGLPVSSPPPPTRVYQVWPGRNVFFFDGRLICGPDPRGLILTAMSVIFSEWIFFAGIVGPSSKHRILIAAFSITLAAAVMALLLLTATRDPGIIPREQTTPPEEAGTRAISSSSSRRIVVNGVETKQQYCGVCRMFRPPRSSHCKVCDNCVDKFDHHCPWVGQCIGLRNYRLYLLLISLALAFYAYTLAFCATEILAKLGAAGAGILSLLKTMPETVALAAFSIVALCFLCCLLLFHAFLVAINQTSHERYRGQYLDSPNPYSMGALKNARECLLGRLPPPRLDFRAMAPPPPRTAVSSASPAPDGGAGEASAATLGARRL